MSAKIGITLSEDIEETIKNKVIQQIKPINFGDEYSIQDVEDLLCEMEHFLGADNVGEPESGKSEFTLLDGGTAHERVTTFKRGENFICKICSKSFACKRYLKKHFSKHTGRFSCPACNKAFARKETQIKHISGCKPGAAKIRKRLKENSPKAPARKPTFLCEICSKTFTRKENLVQHNMVHDGLLVQCEVCEKKFTSVKAFRSHQKLHTGPKVAIPCKMCPATFTTKSNLERHMKQNTHPAKGTVCAKCNKSVKNAATLQKHLDAKTWKCAVCSENFCALSLFKEHMKHQHKDYWLKCKECLKKFHFMTLSAQHLQEHVKKQHSIELSISDCYTTDWFIQFKS